MTPSSQKGRYSPLIILALVAALVAVLAMWATDRASAGRDQANVSIETSGNHVRQYHWKIITTWPKNFPGLGSGAENFSEMIEKMSDGRLTAKVYGAGEIVPPFEVFDAVSQGVADAGHGASYYWKGKIPSSVFFTAIPFGMIAQEMNAWLEYGGGIELWREAYAPFNLIPMAGGNSGTQMAGWFNKEINSVDDIKGLKMRIPGLAGEVFAAAGGTAVRIPGGELYTSLQTGVIDAAEWVGPYNDLAFGLHEVAEYYYYPGWHEAGPTLEFIINRDSYEALPADLQAIVDVATKAANQMMLEEFTARNNRALRQLVDEHGVKLRRLPDDVLRAFARSSDQVMKELVARDPMSAKIYASWKEFYDGVRAYHHISEQAYINARDLAFEDDGVGPP